mmetsp:Transcript_96401/g.132721  ORF Transcript_96401/g.132721 Transcript_96401/m.132721 type:complete len:120 (+) Transcript_96401:348-707(+)
MKRYFDLNYNGEPYDAVTRRKNQDLFYILGAGKVAPPPKAGQANKQPAARPAPKMSSGVTSSGYGGGAKVVSSNASSAADKAQITKLEGQLAELKLQNDTLDKERDFYFGKLRDIEMLL